MVLQLESAAFYMQCPAKYKLAFAKLKGQWDQNSRVIYGDGNGRNDGDGKAIVMVVLGCRWWWWWFTFTVLLCTGVSVIKIRVTALFGDGDDDDSPSSVCCFARINCQFSKTTTVFSPTCTVPPKCIYTCAHWYIIQTIMHFDIQFNGKDFLLSSKNLDLSDLRCLPDYPENLFAFTWAILWFRFL